VVRKKYSAIEHLALIAWGVRFDRNLFAMFTGYFDESGTAQDPHALTVAGSVSTVTKWIRLAPQWEAILKRHGVSVFHMNDCAAGRREYKGWDGAKRKVFIAELSECAARHIKHSFSVSVLLDDWRQVNQVFRFSDHFGNPYVVAGRACVAAVKSWRKRTCETAPIKFVFEDGAQGKGKLLDIMSRHDGTSPIFEPKAEPGLQIADLIAWKNRRVVHDLLTDPNMLTKKQFDESLAPIRRVPFRHVVLDHERMENICRRNNVPAR
jgi:hypothetical protein